MTAKAGDRLPADRVASLAVIVEGHARQRPHHVAVRIGDRELTYRELDEQGHRIAAALVRDGITPGASVAVIASTRLECLALQVGTARAGVVLVPLPAGAAIDGLQAMIDDSEACVVFADQPVAVRAPVIVRFGDDFSHWLAGEDARVAAEPVTADTPATIIYSSGTTGTPKGIVQSHGVRLRMLSSAASRGYTAETIALFATPHYSNMTLAAVMAALGAGATVVLMPKFDAARWLRIAEEQRVDHATLAPVMVQRLLAHPDFDSTDLSAFGIWFCMSAPCSVALKEELLRRWPGELVELYGLTEGGATFLLRARARPDKLGTVGRLAGGCEVKLLDEDDREVAAGVKGEVVGRSAGMMLGYHRRPVETAQSRWIAPDGTVWQRSGDIGVLDDEGFLTLVGRKKDMIISGGFNVYPIDIELVLEAHPAIHEVSVIGVPSAEWGETPVAFVVAPDADPAEIKDWVNARVGKMQRVAEVRIVEFLPRSPVGKVLKRELQDVYAGNTVM